jgi:hypothetical protein
MNNKKKIVFISVIFDSYLLFEENFDLINHQNRDCENIFIVVDNSKNVNLDLVQNLKSKPNVHYIKNQTQVNNVYAKSSFHHASGLDLGLCYLKQNFSFKIDALIILDPDYFVFGSNWITNFLEDMKSNNLFFLGSPYGQRWKLKYKNFPCLQFVMIKNELINHLPSFMPVDVGNRFHLFIHNLKQYKYLGILSNIVLKHSRDTGSLLYLKFKNYSNKIFSEIQYFELCESGLVSVLSSKKCIYEEVLMHNKKVEFFKHLDVYAVHIRGVGNGIKTK